MNLDSICVRRRYAVAIGLLFFPVALQAVSMFGFCLNVPIGKLDALLAILAMSSVVAVLSPVKRCRNVAWALLGLLASICISGLFVMYTNSDAEAYHRPAALLLANGWNPLKITEAADFVDIVGGGRRPWCVAFIPRMSYIFGAALYCWVGFIEVADAVNILMLFAASIFVFDWVEGVVRSKVAAIVFAVLICCSPEVVIALWGGSMDAAWYSAFLIAVICASRKMYLPMVLAMLVMSGVKFTGVVMGVLVFAAFGISLLIWERDGFWRLVKVGIATGVLILLVNVSPYITSTINHGGPFYPSHSFVDSEKFADDKNPITYDVMEMNDDARQLGWAGRFAWGYVSQDLVKWYYGKKLGRSDFRPDFKVSGGVGGYGPVFRFFFVLSMLLWPLVRRREINIVAGLILFSVLIQPTIFSGYARYVPQFYLFPILILMGIALRGHNRFVVGGLMVASSVLAVAVNVKPMSMLPLQWLISVQNLQVLSAARQCELVYIWSSSNYSRDVLAADCETKAVKLKGKDAEVTHGKCAIGSYFRSYVVWVDKKPKDWYDLAHITSNNDPTVIATRNARNARYFVHVFLPTEMRCLFCRATQLTLLRLGQLRRALTGRTHARWYRGGNYGT